MFLDRTEGTKMVLTRWISEDNMCSDYLTKNLPGAVFEKHICPFVGEDDHCVNETANKETLKQ